MQTHGFVLTLTLAIGCANQCLEAQGLVYTLGAQAQYGDDFGRAVADVGDVDGDGVPDIAVGAPFDDANAANSGSVSVYSGRTGEVLWTKSGEHAGDLFGWAVDGVGDINGDGVGDVLVGAPLFDTNGGQQPNGGKAYVISGLDQSVLFDLAAAETNAQLGSTVRGLGDIDGDGVGDFALGVPYDNWLLLENAGTLVVFSGVNGLLFAVHGDETGALLGMSIDTVLVTGSQATTRLIVGEPGVDGLGVDRGQTRILDGFGNVVAVIPGSTNNEWAGGSVAGLGDADGDGVNDFAIAAPYADILFAGVDAGIVRVYSGATFAPRFGVAGASPGANFGQQIAGIGDFDGDGLGDLLAGAPNDDSTVTDGGEARVISGASGQQIASWTGGVNDHMGRSVSSAGDLNQDGFGDLIIGANDAPFGQGQAYVHLAKLTPPTLYCSAKVNSQGCLPSISIEGTASLSIADDCRVIATNVLNQRFGMLFWGTDSNQSPLLGGTLCVSTPLRRTSPQNSEGNGLPDDCSGGYVFEFSHAYMAAQGITPGTRVHAQFWSRDPASSFGAGLTNAVAFSVIP